MKNKKNKLIQWVISLFCGSFFRITFFLLVPVIASAADELPELVLVNKARCMNGLPALSFSPLLKRAAELHSHYMANNQTCSHEQQHGTPVFSGHTPQERALMAAYPFRGSVENVSCSSTDSWEGSVKGLMGAIYHRLAFLSYEVDEVGLSYCKGQSQDPRPHKFTYMMGNSQFRRLCEKVSQTKSLTLPESQPAGTYLYHFCHQPEAKVQALLFHQTKNHLLKSSSAVTVYPWPGQKDVFPAFLDNEVPDPTPVLQLSGIPISVQFNPVRFEEVDVIAFKLKDSLGRPVDVWRLDSFNDPHEKLSEYEYAWFPVRPLLRETTYSAQVDYVADGHKHQKIWSFQTQAHLHKVVWSIEERGETVIAPEGQRVTIQWQGQTSDVITGMACKCFHCEPRHESFDTVSLIAESQDVTCEIKDKLGQRVMFTVQPL